MKAKLSSYNDVHLIAGEAVGFHWRNTLEFPASGTPHERSQLSHVSVRTDDGKVYPIQFSVCMNAAGVEASDVARLAGIGATDGALEFALPVMARSAI